jgi:three-Cys-motif partner protein
MSEPGFKFDEVGDWSILKLNIIENYASAYTKRFIKRGRHLKKYYIDGFSGAGSHRVKGTRKQIEGSPTRALKVKPPFDGFYFIDLDTDKADYLQKQCELRSDVQIVNATPMFTCASCCRQYGTSVITGLFACSTLMDCI